MGLCLDGYRFSILSLGKVESTLRTCPAAAGRTRGAALADITLETPPRTISPDVKAVSAVCFVRLLLGRSQVALTIAAGSVAFSLESPRRTKLDQTDLSELWYLQPLPDVIQRLN